MTRFVMVPETATEGMLAFLNRWSVREIDSPSLAWEGLIERAPKYEPTDEQVEAGALEVRRVMMEHTAGDMSVAIARAVLATLEG